MTAWVRLSGTLPTDLGRNGFDAIADQLVTDPDEPIAVLIVVDVSKVTHDVDTGQDVPTLRVRRAEPIGRLGDVPASVTALAEQLFEERTGRKALPFDQLELDEQGLSREPE